MRLKGFVLFERGNYVTGRCTTGNVSVGAKVFVNDQDVNDNAPHGAQKWERVDVNDWLKELDAEAKDHEELARRARNRIQTVRREFG